MEIPAANSFKNCTRAGILNKLIGKGWFNSGTWKKRYCVLDGTKFYYYENQNANGTEKSSGIISLDYYDVCEECDEKTAKKVPNSFQMNTSVRGFFDHRHIFSTDSPDDMMLWIHHIISSIHDARVNRSKRGRSKKKRNSSTDICEGVIRNLDSDTSNRLYSPTKYRSHGPRGRRLPQRKTLLTTMAVDGQDELKMRSTSMTALHILDEENEESEKWYSVSMENLADLDEEDKSDDFSKDSSEINSSAAPSLSEETFSLRGSVKRKTVMNTQQALLINELRSKLTFTGNTDKEFDEVITPKAPPKPVRSRFSVEDKSNSRSVHSSITDNEAENTIHLVSKDISTIIDFASLLKSRCSSCSLNLEKLSRNLQELDSQENPDTAELESLKNKTSSALKRIQQVRKDQDQMLDFCNTILKDITSIESSIKSLQISQISN